MAGVSGGKVILEARTGMARGARRSSQAKQPRQTTGDAFIVPVRKRDCAGSGSAPDEFKLFNKSAKWFLRNESGLGGTRGICYPRRTDGNGEQNGEHSSGARTGPERGCRAEHDRDRGDWPVRGEFAGNPGDGRAAGTDRVARGGAPGDAGCLCVVGARSGDYDRGRLVVLFAISGRFAMVWPIEYLLFISSTAGDGYD